MSLTKLRVATLVLVKAPKIFRFTINLANKWIFPVDLYIALRFWRIYAKNLGFLGSHDPSVHGDASLHHLFNLA